MHPTFKPLAALVLALSLSLQCAGAGAAVTDDIHALAAPSQQPLQRFKRPYEEQEWVDRFYAARAYAPAWIGAGAPRAAAAIALLKDAPSQGMQPSDYEADRLAQQFRNARAGEAALDVALTRTMLRYLADLRVGRVRSEYHGPMPDPRLKTYDPVEQLRAAYDANDLGAAVAKAEPRIPFYKHIKKTLAQYRELAKASVDKIPDIAKGSKFEAGAPYPQAASLRKLLQLVGDLPAGPMDGPDDTYTPELAAAVKRFQGRHGLLDDGILGRDTAAALNVPLSQRVRQLELTLERLRWLPDFPDGPVIAVNLPGFRLWAFEHANSVGVPALEMRVIVGTAVKTQTPLFIGNMRYLEFNPYWNIPRSIERKELIPKLEKNAEYLKQNNMELLPRSGGGAPSDEVDAAALAGLKAGTLRARQKPGPANALGAVKFAMPNPDDIYLHSTSARELFKRTRRDLSHGCIRVEKPEELAKFVLASKPEWTSELIAEAMSPGNPTKTVTLKAPIPVILFYTTAIADREGHAIFSPDVYKRDPMLEKALNLERAPALPLPAAAPQPATQGAVKAQQ